jgi:hypothetical protein
LRLIKYLNGRPKLLCFRTCSNFYTIGKSFFIGREQSFESECKSKIFTSWYVLISVKIKV